jgi:hypothetical protein
VSGYILCQNKLAPTSRWRLIDHIAVLGDLALSRGTGAETHRVSAYGIQGYFGLDRTWETSTYIYQHESIDFCLQEYTLST